jgi:hypothetical protein
VEKAIAGTMKEGTLMEGSMVWLQQIEGGSVVPQASLCID